VSLGLQKKMWMPPPPVRALAVFGAGAPARSSFARLSSPPSSTSTSRTTTPLILPVGTPTLARGHRFHHPENQLLLNTEDVCKVLGDVDRPEGTDLAESGLDLTSAITLALQYNRIVVKLQTQGPGNRLTTGGNVSGVHLLAGWKCRH
jgi:hypothetical protein